MQTAYINARVTTLDPSRPRARGVLVTDGCVERLLDDAPAGLPKDVRIVDCRGAAIVPGLHDCHVHLTDAGLLAGRYDVRDCTDISAVLRRVAELCRDAGERDTPLYAGNYDEASIAERRPPTLRELDGAVPDRPVLLTRVDGHSCVVNSAALAFFGAQVQAGADRDAAGALTGRLSGAANYEGQTRVMRSLTPSARRAASERAADMALRAGITTAHHVIANDAPFEQLEDAYRDDATLPLRVISKTCSTDVQKVKRLGARVFGGDVFVDGSIGSRTAALCEDYRGSAGRGALYLTRPQLAELFDEAARAGMSFGVHAIGDRAIDEAIGAWEDVVAEHGPPAGIRPSIDHFEIARPDHIERAARLGMLLSVQPAFDHLWGGDGGMYEERLGTRRALSMNLFKSAQRAGCVICGGSDAPVTQLSALLGIHSLMNHHVASERFTAREALRAYTADAAKLSFDEGRRGALLPGYDADFTVLEAPLDSVQRDAVKDVRVLMTVVAGETKYSSL